MDSVPGKTIRWIFGPMPNCSLDFEKLGASSLVSELGRQEHNFKNSQNRPPTARCEHRRPEDRRHFLSHLNFILTFCHEEGRVWPPGPTDGRAAPNAAGTQALERRAVRFTAHREQKPRNGAHLTRGTSQRRVRRRSSPIRPSHLAPPARNPNCAFARLLLLRSPPPPKGNIGNQPALHATCT